MAPPSHCTNTTKCTPVLINSTISHQGKSGATITFHKQQQVYACPSQLNYPLSGGKMAPPSHFTNTTKCMPVIINSTIRYQGKMAPPSHCINTTKCTPVLINSTIHYQGGKWRHLHIHKHHQVYACPYQLYQSPGEKWHHRPISQTPPSV